jgi:DNA-binding NarL/FixJ family response regulator
VVGKLDSAREAIAAIRESPPDVLVTEIDTRDGPMSGIEAVAALREVAPHSAAIVLSAQDEPSALEAAFAAGASAYVLKSAAPEDIAVAARQTATRSVYTAVPRPARPEPPAPAPTENPLTPRELEVLVLAAQGRANSAIAAELQITEQTVKLHLSNTYRKLGVSNRTQASRRAAALGLLPPRSSGEVYPHLLASAFVEIPAGGEGESQD